MEISRTNLLNLFFREKLNALFSLMKLNPAERVHLHPTIVDTALHDRFHPLAIAVGRHIIKMLIHGRLIIHYDGMGNGRYRLGRWQNLIELVTGDFVLPIGLRLKVHIDALGQNPHEIVK